MLVICLTYTWQAKWHDPSVLTNKSDQIFEEIHELLEEQVKILRGKLTPYEVVRYADCRTRIEQLLQQLRQDGFDGKR